MASELSGADLLKGVKDRRTNSKNDWREQGLVVGKKARRVGEFGEGDDLSNA